MSEEESDEYEFSDAHSSNNFPISEEKIPESSQLFIVNNASDIFSIEGPTESVTSEMSESDSDDFYDVIEQQSESDKNELLESKHHVLVLNENTVLSATPHEQLSRRKQKGFTILEFLQEEDEEENEGNVNNHDDDIKNDDLNNRRETVYEFLNSYDGGEKKIEIEEESESSLSQLQTELEQEQDRRTVRQTILNLPMESNSAVAPSLPRRRESILRRANPLASFFVDEATASDSDSMISELTEALTTRTDLSETRFSRVPSQTSTTDYLKLAKRYKPVPVKTKCKQKSEFASLLLIQELNRSQQRSSGLDGSSPGITSAADSSKAIFVLKFSPDGQFLAAAGAEGIVKIWSLLQVDDTSVNSTNTNRIAAIFDSDPLQVLRGHTAEILDCAWSTNNFLLSASMDKTVRLWHHSRSDALGIFQHLDYVTSVAFHPRDPRIFISGSLDCKLRLWSIQDRSILHWNELPPGNYITAVAFTRSGLTVIAGTSGGTALIFDTDQLRYNTQILVRSSRSKSVGKKITSIEAVPGNYEHDDRIVISSNDSRIRVYSLRDKNVLYKYKGHENASSQIGANLSTDADFILSGSEDCRVYLWRVDGKFEKKSFFDSFRKDHIKSYESFKAHSNPVTAAIFAPNCITDLLQSLQLRPVNPLQSTEGKIIVTADVTGQIKVFENNSKLIEWLK